jgi:hypothetical protein
MRKAGFLLLSDAASGAHEKRLKCAVIIVLKGWIEVFMIMW